jgi:hypothetical protein
MKSIALAFTLAVAGCAYGEKSTAQSTQAASVVHSPYEHYLPQAPPSETNRVEFPAGYSIVSPVGWTARTIPIEGWMKDNVTDQIEITGHEADEYRPRITIQPLGPGEYALYKGWLQSTQSLPDGWIHTQFQGQPALSKFLTGSGSRQAVRGSYQPWLSQYLFCERSGNGFILIFDMRNADKDKPYYTHPLPIIEEYFETFRYKPSEK